MYKATIRIAGFQLQRLWPQAVKVTTCKYAALEVRLHPIGIEGSHALFTASPCHTVTDIDPSDWAAAGAPDHLMQAVQVESRHGHPVSGVYQSAAAGEGFFSASLALTKPAPTGSVLSPSPISSPPASLGFELSDDTWPKTHPATGAFTKLSEAEMCADVVVKEPGGGKADDSADDVTDEPWSRRAHEPAMMPAACAEYPCSHSGSLHLLPRKLDASLSWVDDAADEAVVEAGEKMVPGPSCAEAEGPHGLELLTVLQNASGIFKWDQRSMPPGRVRQSFKDLYNSGRYTDEMTRMMAKAHIGISADEHNFLAALGGLREKCIATVTNFIYSFLEQHVEFVVDQGVVALRSHVRLRLRLPAVLGHFQTPWRFVSQVRLDGSGIRAENYSNNAGYVVHNLPVLTPLSGGQVGISKFHAISRSRGGEECAGAGAGAACKGIGGEGEGGVGGEAGVGEWLPAGARGTIPHILYRFNGTQLIQEGYAPGIGHYEICCERVGGVDRALRSYEDGADSVGHYSA